MKQASGWYKHLDFMVLDIVCLHLSYALAYCLRFGWGNPYDGREWRTLIIVMTLFDLLTMVFGGMLEGVLRRGYLREAMALARQILILELLSVAFLFLIHESDSYSRIVVLLTGVLYLLFAFAVRSGWKKLLLKRLHQRRQRVLLVGSSELAGRYASQLDRDDGMQTAKIVAYLTAQPCPGIPAYAGDLDRLEQYLAENAADEVVLAPSLEEENEMIHIVDLCEKYGVRIQVIPFYNDVISSNPKITVLGDLKLLNFRATPLDEMTNALIKRSIDIVGSLLLIILTSPVMLCAAIGTRLSSPGPVLFRQERVGKDRKPFKMLKFRSMRVTGTEDTGWSTKDDPRKTKLGSFIRKFSIDELPQMFNVLAGQMSLIGPRPEVPFHVNHFKDEIPLYLVRQQVRPGITGWAQVNGLRGDTSIEERVKYDIWYIENWSLALDIKIVWKTVFGGLVNAETVKKAISPPDKMANEEALPSEERRTAG